MNLRKVCLPLGLALTLSPGIALRADVAPTNPTPTAAQTLSAQEVQEMDAKVRELHELFNRLELQAEQTKSQIDKAKPQPVSFGQGELKLMNSTAWPVAHKLSGTAVASTFDTMSGLQVLQGLNLNPVPEVTGNVQFELFGPVALDRFLPQKENDLYRNNQVAALRKAEVKFENEYMMSRAFRAIPRPDLFEEGDMFYLLPAADDTNTYFRQTGRTVPNGVQFLAKDGLGIAKGFEVWAGDELAYAIVPEIFARYKRQVFGIDFALMADWQDDKNYERGAATWARQEGWIRFPLWAGESLDIAAVRQAGQVGQTYQVVESVAAGTGTLGTNYLVTTKTTTESDAWAETVRLKGLRSIPLFEEHSLTFVYGGPLAVNVMSVSGLLSARPQRYTLFSVEGGWQKPVVGVNPAVNIGTPSLSFGAMPGTGARVYGSPVAVVDDSISGANNREMTWLTATIEFNPGQGWFYKYRPRIVDDWNFNSDLKTPFSTALSVHLYNCPTGTDLTRSFGPGGVIQLEPAGSTGKFPTNGWLYEAKDITSVGVGSVQTWLELATGQQTAGLSPANTVIPANTYFSGSLTSRYKAVTLSGGYAEDIYGPEDWYRTFGIIIGNQYKASLTYTMGSSDISIQYQGWRDKDPSKYHNPTNTVLFAGGSVLVEPPIDQVMTSYTIRF